MQVLQATRRLRATLQTEWRVAMDSTSRLSVARLAMTMVLTLAATSAIAQMYPGKPVRLVVPYPAGGSSDLQARIVGQGLGERLGQPVIVENKPGASASIGTDFVAKQPADGYTLLLAAPPFVITPHVQKRLPYDARKDFSGVTLLTRAPMVVAVGSGFAGKGFADLVVRARAEPGLVTYGSVGAGGQGHLATELLARRLGVRFLHVPYKGSAPAITDLAGGQIAMMLTTQLDLASQISAGRVWVVATGAPQRSVFLPDVPTIQELGFAGIDLGFWFSGVVARAGTPFDIVSLLSAEIAAVMKRPDVRAKLAAQSVEVIGSTPAEFDAFLNAEHARVAEAVSISGVSAD